MTTIDLAVKYMRECEAWSSFWTEDDMAILARACIEGLIEGGDSAAWRCVAHDAPETFKQDVLGNYRNVLREILKETPGPQAKDASG